MEVSEISTIEEAREWFAYKGDVTFQFEQIERILEANLDLMPTAFGRICSVLLDLGTGHDTRNYLITRRGNVFSTQWAFHDRLIEHMALDTDDIERAGWVRITWMQPFVEDAYSPAVQCLYQLSAQQLRVIKSMHPAILAAFHRDVTKKEARGIPQLPMPKGAPVIAHYERRMATKMTYRA